MNEKSDIYKDIGLKIKEFRKEKKLTQIELAEKLDVSVSYISKIEAENCKKSFSLQLLYDIANTLEIDIKDFFD